MRTLLATPLRRVVLSCAAAAVLVGGAVSSIHAADHTTASTAAPGSAGVVSPDGAAAVAAIHDAGIARAQALGTRARTVLQDSAGTVDEALRAELTASLDALDGAVAARDNAAVATAVAATTAVLDRMQDAILDHKVAAAHSAGEAEAEAARLAAEQDAARAAAAREDARVAAEREATRTAAREAAAVSKAAATAASSVEQPAEPAPPRTLTLSGSQLMVGIWFDNGSEFATLDIDEATGTCSTAGRGFGDIRAGARVTVYDEHGSVIATTTLGGGTVTVIEVDEAEGFFPRSVTGECAWSFSAQVPERPFYQVEVAHRGKVAFAKDEIGGVRLRLG